MNVLNWEHWQRRVARELATRLPVWFPGSAPIDESRLSRAVQAQQPFQLEAIPGWFAFRWDFGAFREWTRLPQRLFWTRQLPSVHRTGFLASSRLGREWERYPEWFEALRTSLFQFHRQGLAVVTADGTTADVFVRRLAELLGTELLRLRAWPDPGHVTERTAPPRVHGLQIHHHWIPLSEEGADRPTTIDREMITQADVVRVLAVQRRRNVHQGLNQRLIEHSPGSTWLLCHPDLTPRGLRDELLSQGAIDWLLQPDQKAASLATTARPDTVMGPDDDRVNRQKFLLHCTRAPKWKSAKSTNNANVDELLFHCRELPTGPLVSLFRILISDRITATRELTAGSHPVVCLSSRRLQELPQLRTYRRHLGRWDFEPFGVAITVRAAERLGSRPVMYGTRDQQALLNDADRPFFQLARSRIGSEWIDWTVEQEHRILGDVPLRQLGPDDALVFVSDQASAGWIAPFSRWPVVCLQDS